MLPQQPSETPQTDDTDLYKAMYLQLSARTAKHDEANRRNPALRVCMVKFIEDLDQLVLERAESLTEVLGHSSMDQFEVDKARALIVWQLQEYLSRALLDRDDEYCDYLQHYQLTRQHAKTWFDADETAVESKICITEGREIIFTDGDKLAGQGVQS